MAAGDRFDEFARTYEAVHAANVAASGEPPAYFAAYKLAVIERLLGTAFDAPLLDFGCGIGALTALISGRFRDVHAWDPSSVSLAAARSRAPRARFFEHGSALPEGHYGAVILANVLHHLAPPDRPALVARVASLLAPGGKLIVFEHNPLNPLTRRAVSVCPFDERAHLLYPWELKRLLRGAGASDVALDFIVFFPRLLRAARPLEPRLAWLPLGAQVCAWGIRK